MSKKNRADFDHSRAARELGQIRNTLFALLPTIRGAFPVKSKPYRAFQKAVQAVNDVRSYLDDECPPDENGKSPYYPASQYQTPGCSCASGLAAHGSKGEKCKCQA